MTPCPTCGGFHRPEQPHQPPTVPKAPPEQPRPEPDRAQADADTGLSETADQSSTDSGERKDEEEDSEASETPAAGRLTSVKPGYASEAPVAGKLTSVKPGDASEIPARAGRLTSVKPGDTSEAPVAGQLTSVKPGDASEAPAEGQMFSVKDGVRSTRATGTFSAKPAAGGPAEGQMFSVKDGVMSTKKATGTVSIKSREAEPNGERPRVSIRQQGASGEFIAPPPPDGSNAGVWDHYMRSLPPTHRNRAAARQEINQSVQELDRAAGIDALADYAHSDDERKFLEFTGYLPTLDEKRDEQILAQEFERRTQGADFEDYTGQKRTGDFVRDTEVWEAESDRRRSKYETEFKDYTGQESTGDPARDREIWQTVVNEGRQEYINDLLTEGFRTSAEVESSLERAREHVARTRERVESLRQARDRGENITSDQWTRADDQKRWAEASLQRAEANAGVYLAADRLRTGWERGISETEQQALIDQIRTAYEGVGRSEQRLHFLRRSEARDREYRQRRQEGNVIRQYNTGPNNTPEWRAINPDGSLGDRVGPPETWQGQEGETWQVYNDDTGGFDRLTWIRPDMPDSQVQETPQPALLETRGLIGPDSPTEPTPPPPPTLITTGAITVDETSAAGGHQPDLVGEGLASSPYATEADYDQDVQATGFSKELEELTGADSPVTGALASSAEWQDLLTRMRESGHYTAESLDALEENARASDQQMVSSALANMSPELRTVALERIKQGEDPFAVVQAHTQGIEAVNRRMVSNAIADMSPELRTVALERIEQGEDPHAVLQANYQGIEAVNRRMVSSALSDTSPELRTVALQRIEQGEDPLAVVQANAQGVYDQQFRDYTGRESTGDLVRDQEIWDGETRRREDLEGNLQVQQYDSLFDDNSANAQAWARYSSEFKTFTGKDPTGDEATDQAVWDEAVARHSGPDVGPRPPRELLQGSLADAAPAPRSDFALDNAAPARAPIVYGPDVATVTPPRGSVPVPTAQPQSAPPPDIEGWKALGSVYINNEEVSVEEIIRRRLPADNADYGHHLERAEQEAFQYLREGHASGAVQLEQRSVREGTLTREDLGDSFTVDGVSYSTEEYFGSVVQTGPRASQLQRHHTESVERKLEELNDLWREGRVGVEGRPETNTFSELPGERSHLGRGVDPLDYIVPGYALGTEVIEAQDVHTRHGTGIAPEESAAISREGAFSTVDLFPLPVGAALKTAGRGSGVLFDASGNILRRGTLPASTPQGVIGATNRQAAELIAEGMEPAMARNVAAQSQGFNDGMELAYWRGLYERHGAGHPTVVSMLPQNRGPGTVVASGITTPRPPQPAPPLRYGPSQPGLRTPKYLGGDQHRVRITGEPDRSFEITPIQQEIGGLHIQRGQYYMGDAGPSYTTGLQSRLDSGTGGGPARPGDFGSPHVASPPTMDVPVASSGRGSGPVATLERTSVDVSSLPALQLPTTEVSTRTARAADPDRGFTMAAGRQTEDVASGPARSSTGAADYSFLDPPYGAPDYPGVSAASPQIISRGHGGVVTTTPSTPLRYRARTATPGARPSAAAQPTTTSVAGAPLVQTPSGLYVPAAAVSPALTVAQQQRTADAVETATVVDHETGLVADVAVDPETGTTVGVDRETGTSVVVDGRTGTARVIEPGTGLRTGVDQGLTTRAFSGERVFRPTDASPSIRPFTGESLRVAPDVGIRTRLVEDTGVQGRNDARVQPGEATGLQQGLATGTDTGLSTGTTTDLGTDAATSLETGTDVGTAEFTAPEFRVPRDFPEFRPDVPDGERIRPDDPGGRPRQDDPESRRRKTIRPRPDMPGPQKDRQAEAAVGAGDPVEAEFVTYELNRVNFLTGETEEIPLDDSHEETLRVTKRGRKSTSGVDVDTGGVTVSSRGGRVSASDGQSQMWTPKPGVMKPPRPASAFPKGGGRRRRDEDFEEYNGRNSRVTITLK